MIDTSSTESESVEQQNQTHFDLQYASASNVELTDQGTQVALPGNLLRPPVNLQGRIKYPLRFREALATLYAVVGSDYRYVPKDRTRRHIATLLALLCTEAPREVVEHEGKTYYVSLGPRCLPQGAPTSPALTNIACQRLDRRLTGLAQKYHWRYTRYADDLTFSLPATHKGKPHLGTMLGEVTRIVSDEGFEIHAKKTRIARQGSRQKVTGLVVNGEGPARVPRQLKRRLRAAIHYLEQGQSLPHGENIESLIGYAAYINMSQPELGTKLLRQLQPFAQPQLASS